MARFRDYHRTVVGFHGTTHATAKRIVTGAPMRPSRNEYDWLGHGVYFWEYGPQQAYQWARQNYSDNTRIAVVGSMIRLGNCFDLLDPVNADLLVEAKKVLQLTLPKSQMPRNHNARKWLDCAVFESFYQIRKEESDIIDTARAVYVPTGNSKRLWERSWLYRETHVQLCVRNVDNILGAWIVQPEG